jgi:ABC-2 type transport system ATP-binding protein
MERASIEIEGLTKRYGQVLAVDDLSLTVRKGEIFCFLGPNGAGKTTTMKILAGLLRPTAGRALVEGVDVVKDPIEAKRAIGYIPDMPYLYERLTASEFYLFAGGLYRIPRETVLREMDEAFALFGLNDLRGMLVRELSHGMRQRLIYCVTFLHHPAVLMVDEPLIGLDPHTIRLLKDLLRQRAREGMTVFLTTHILALAEDIADRIGIVQQGRLVALGTLADLRSRFGGHRLEDIFLGLTERDGTAAGAAVSTSVGATAGAPVGASTP